MTGSTHDRHLPVLVSALPSDLLSSMMSLLFLSDRLPPVIIPLQPATPASGGH